MSKRKDVLDALRRKQKQREARRLPVRTQDEVAVRLREIVTAMEKCLADPQLACSRWPWQADPRSEREYVTEWRRREWQRWFEQRVAFPFEAEVLTSEGPALHTVEDIGRATPEGARRMGIYFGIRCSGTKLGAGASAIYPLDLSTPNAATFAEYRAYRDLAGPRPGVKGRRGAPPTCPT